MVLSRLLTVPGFGHEILQQYRVLAGTFRAAFAVTLATLCAVFLVVARRRFAEPPTRWPSAIWLGIPGFFAVLAASCGVDACLIGFQRNAIRERIVRDYPAFRGKYESYVSRSLPSLPLRLRLGLVPKCHEALSLALSLWPEGPDADAVAYRHLAAIKGLKDADAVARRVAASTRLRDLASEVNASRARLNRLFNATVSGDRRADHDRVAREEAERLTALETRLARSINWSPAPPDFAKIAAALPPGGALVDLFRYRRHAVAPDGKAFVNQPQYVAFVIRPGRGPRRVELGPADAIDEALAAWRARLRSEGGDSAGPGTHLARLVWKPLVDHLDGVDTVLVAPDRDLCFLPWSALPDGEGGPPLLRRLRFAVVTSARQLTESAPTPVGGGLLAVGGVDYGRSGEPVAAAVEAIASKRPAASVRDSAGFKPLPATRAEAEAIADLFRQHKGGTAEVLAGAASKSRVVSAMAGKRYLHLATHGYFAPPEMRSALGDDRRPATLAERTDRAETSGWYPGLLSALAWAGAAHPPLDPTTGNPDPGACLLSAEEVGGLDLKGCERPEYRRRRQSPALGGVDALRRRRRPGGGRWIVPVQSQTMRRAARPILGPIDARRPRRRPLRPHRPAGRPGRRSSAGSREEVVPGRTGMERAKFPGRSGSSRGAVT